MTYPSALAEAVGLLGERAIRDAPLGARTTYRVGGAAALLITAQSEADLRVIGRAAITTGLPTLVLGRGSNLLVADRGFPGIAISLGEAFSAVEVEVDVERVTVTAGAAAPLPTVARVSAAASLVGLEWAVGIPGSVGGAIRMNAGGHGAETVDCLDAWAFVDLHGGADGERAGAELGAGYRSSVVRSHDVVTWARFRAERGRREDAEATIAEIVRWRREHQPGGQNAGSVFTNPPGDSAGRLIDAAGCKGLRIGSAEVSSRHANFIQADPAGRASDVAALIAEVRRRVSDATGVTLEPELRLVGFDEVIM
ncbi:MAG TPA: UDP-N-acetylmuramate dehydrogenase [Acidimicrobiales bacterium]|nr:UDP-N-acetylmuramate dehydrogenase [Acidimicrobiales bacterium]